MMTGFCFKKDFSRYAFDTVENVSRPVHRVSLHDDEGQAA
jgi:hypothetical protein